MSTKAINQFTFKKRIWEMFEFPVYLREVAKKVLSLMVCYNIFPKKRLFLSKNWRKKKKYQNLSPAILWLKTKITNPTAIKLGGRGVKALMVLPLRKESLFLRLPIEITNINKSESNKNFKQITLSLIWFKELGDRRYLFCLWRQDYEIWEA